MQPTLLVTRLDIYEARHFLEHESQLKLLDANAVEQVVVDISREASPVRCTHPSLSHSVTVKKEIVF